MASRRKLSFDLLRYVDVPALNENGLAVKSHSRRRRHKKKFANSAHATVDNGQIYSNDDLHLADSSSLRKCATVDIGCLADLSMGEDQQLGVSDAFETADGIISRYPHDADGNEPDKPNALLGHANGPNGISHIERVDSVETEDMNGPERSFSIAYSVVEDVSNKNESGLLQRVSPAVSNCKVGFLEHISPAELRQRNVNVNADVAEGNGDEIVESVKERGSGVLEEPQPEKKISHAIPQLGDLERVMAETSEYPSYSGMSPLGYFLREINRGNSLRSTTSVGNDKERQRVYNTMFHVPWRCELLIDVGFFVCLDSFLSLLTIMPARILGFFWRCLYVRFFFGFEISNHAVPGIFEERLLWKVVFKGWSQASLATPSHNQNHSLPKLFGIAVSGIFEERHLWKVVYKGWSQASLATPFHNQNHSLPKLFGIAVSGNHHRSLLSVGNCCMIAVLYILLSLAWQFQIPLADDLSDFGCFVVLIWGVALLQVTDISLIYHFIRGQGTIKLYVVYNVLEIFDKLCQSFGGDVLQVLFNSAVGVARSSKEHMALEIVRFILDLAIAVVAFIAHSFIILAQAITLSAAIIAHNNALMALLVSNNFAEIKSNVFKKVSTENLQKMACYDTVERFHIMAFIIFVLAQNILEAESSWFWSFVMNSCMIWSCEVLVDVIKHAFLVKFNEIKPDAYSEFLEALCKQTLNQSNEVHKTLTFVPLAPACVVIRALTPIYASRLPFGPVWWRWFWIALLFTVTYLMLASLKVVVGLGLQSHARWYIRRCLRKQRHLHAD